MDNDQNQEYFIDPWGKLVYITKTRKKTLWKVQTRLCLKSLNKHNTQTSIQFDLDPTVAPHVD